MEESIIEFHLEYNPNRKNPAEIFHAMGDFISAYEQFGKVIAQSVNSDLTFEAELKEVSHGCILATLLLRGLERLTNPDDMIRSLTGEVSDLAGVKKITRQAEDRVKSEMRKNSRFDNRTDPVISDLDAAFAMEQWSKGNSKLNPGEHLSVCNKGEYNNNVIPFDPSFRYTGDTKKMFSRHIANHDGMELIEIFKPCCKGNGQWEVKSRQTNSVFRAEIVDKEWLMGYQKSEERLGGSDYLKVHSQYDIVQENGKEIIKNAKIIKVIEVIKHCGDQDGFPF